VSNLKELGIALRAYRVAAGESIDELAEATELNTEDLKKLEAGLHKPAGSMIEMLARHFSLREQEVARLFDLAGHKSEEFDFDLEKNDIDLDKLTKDFDVLFAPIFYTDMVNVVSNDYGITINFIQNGSGSEKPVVVSRVGMSHKHAESIITVLQESLKRAKEQKRDSADSAEN
jgi:transcriptional regulator with XRE-family HTH domain